MAWSEEKKLNRYNLTHRIVDGVLYKKCSKCLEWKPLNKDNFYEWNRSPDGFNAQCVECSKEYVNRKNANNPEAHRLATQKWYANNSDYKKEYVSNWYQENKEYKQQYFLNYQRMFPEKMAIHNEKRRKHKEHNITLSEFNNCLKYFNHRCAYCGKPIEEHYNMYLGKLRWENLQREHVNHDGSNDLINCVPSCKSCNDRKNIKDLDEWYNINNINYTQERYDRIIKWLMEDCFQYVEVKKPKGKYVRKQKLPNTVII